MGLLNVFCLSIHFAFHPNAEVSFHWRCCSNYQNAVSSRCCRYVPIGPYLQQREMVPVEGLSHSKFWQNQAVVHMAPHFVYWLALSQNTLYDCLLQISCIIFSVSSFVSNSIYANICGFRGPTTAALKPLQRPTDKLCWTLQPARAHFCPSTGHTPC